MVNKSLIGTFGGYCCWCCWFVFVVVVDIVLLLLILLLWPCLLLLVSYEINVNLRFLNATLEFLWWVGVGVGCRGWLRLCRIVVGVVTIFLGPRKDIVNRLLT